MYKSSDRYGRWINRRGDARRRTAVTDPVALSQEQQAYRQRFAQRRDERDATCQA